MGVGWGLCVGVCVGVGVGAGGGGCGWGWDDYRGCYDPVLEISNSRSPHSRLTSRPLSLTFYILSIKIVTSIHLSIGFIHLDPCSCKLKKPTPKLGSKSITSVYLRFSFYAKQTVNLNEL